MMGGDPVLLDDAKRPTLMARRFPAIAILVAMVVLGVFAAIDAPAACACTATEPPLPPSPIEGVVVAVDSAGLGDVRAFTLRLPDRTTILLTVGFLENATEFSPSHLAEHQASSEPVRAFYRLVDGSPFVYRLEDVAT